LLTEVRPLVRYNPPTYSRSEGSSPGSQSPVTNKSHTHTTQFNITSQLPNNSIGNQMAKNSASKSDQQLQNYLFYGSDKRLDLRKNYYGMMIYSCFFSPDPVMVIELEGIS